MVSYLCFAFGLGFVLGYFGCLLAYKGKIDKLAEDFVNGKESKE